MAEDSVVHGRTPSQIRKLFMKSHKSEKFVVALSQMEKTPPNEMPAQVTMPSLSPPTLGELPRVDSSKHTTLRYLDVTKREKQQQSPRQSIISERPNLSQSVATTSMGKEVSLKTTLPRQLKVLPLKKIPPSKTPKQSTRPLPNAPSFNTPSQSISPPKSITMNRSTNASTASKSVFLKLHDQNREFFWREALGLLINGEDEKQFLKFLCILLSNVTISLYF